MASQTEGGSLRCWLNDNEWLRLSSEHTEQELRWDNTKQEFNQHWQRIRSLSFLSMFLMRANTHADESQRDRNET